MPDVFPLQDQAFFPVKKNVICFIILKIYFAANQNSWAELHMETNKPIKIPWFIHMWNKKPIRIPWFV